MPSQPLSPDRSAVVKLHTRIDVEAIDIVKDRTDLPAAVARLALLVPPARVDLVDDVLAAVGQSIRGHRIAWPPPGRRYELAYQVNGPWNPCPISGMNVISPSSATSFNRKNPEMSTRRTES